MGNPKNRWFISWKIPIYKLMIWGYPTFRKSRCVGDAKLKRSWFHYFGINSNVQHMFYSTGVDISMKLWKKLTLFIIATQDELAPFVLCSMVEYQEISGAKTICPNQTWTNLITYNLNFCRQKMENLYLKSKNPSPEHVPNKTVPSTIDIDQFSSWCQNLSNGLEPIFAIFCGENDLIIAGHSFQDHPFLTGAKRREWGNDP